LERISVALFLGLIAYAAVIIFVGGMLYRMAAWLSAPAPLNIPTTPGPTTVPGVVGRVAAEVLFFRSLLRDDRWLWFISWGFHATLVLVLLRHLRYFLLDVAAAAAAVPAWLMQLQTLGVYAGIALPIFLFLLLLRRFHDAKVAFISTFADYFALLLLLSIAVSGLLMRYYFRTDLLYVKNFALHLLALSPGSVPADRLPGWAFIVHYLLVVTLLIYFPFSKLVHAGLAAAFNPTRNQTNTPRTRRHINPWNDQYSPG
jgi:nitrate reductase gamma subunit